MLIANLKMPILQRKSPSIYSELEGAVDSDVTSAFSLGTVNSESENSPPCKEQKCSASNTDLISKSIDNREDAEAFQLDSQSNRYTLPELPMPTPTPMTAHTTTPRGILKQKPMSSHRRESIAQSQNTNIRPKSTCKVLTPHYDRQRSQQNPSPQPGRRGSFAPRTQNPQIRNTRISMGEGNGQLTTPAYSERRKSITSNMREGNGQLTTPAYSGRRKSGASTGTCADFISREPLSTRGLKKKQHKRVAFSTNADVVNETYDNCVYERGCKKTTAKYSSKLTDMKIYKVLCKYKFTEMPMHQDSIQNIDFRMAHVQGDEMKAQKKVLAKLGYRIPSRNSQSLVNFTQNQRHPSVSSLRKVAQN
ncbi:hypothetical protein SARC_09550 [Sphaeroforma arctica JP610]|uniref:Uncharacterized protein n=1 Tax=Sphaeroforma arctica JP610 TaxID=667725 RepID=A0A0L0FNF0_9EUKA|nr:hypothetical protein SARC_09550 [Sphaeroforma arctica JP610]KNC78006.1 hypothetical protein SARC_09550 [Sphaeroforma arctica JP610]|eukprot:XP_014151908.1 hypothetical protein SARC_09550 [Sphaeroforma arctica JP610]